jgi:hypothetical protein
MRFPRKALVLPLIRRGRPLPPCDQGLPSITVVLGSLPCLGAFVLGVFGGYDVASSDGDTLAAGVLAGAIELNRFEDVVNGALWPSLHAPAHQAPGLD